MEVFAGEVCAATKRFVVATRLDLEPDSLFGHATFRAFVTVFRAVLGFFRTLEAVFFDFGAVLSEAGNSSLRCFAMR